MCRLRNIAMRDYQESVTTGQTHTRTHTHMDRQTDAGQIDPYVPLCFAGDTKTRHVFVKHGCPWHQQSQNLTKFQSPTF